MQTSPRQRAFDELGTPLIDTTFVVLDLETTGGSADSDNITEVGALKVKGGAVLGTFSTLVRPSAPIAPSIELLTGITNAMVERAPPIEEVLPSLCEFMKGSVLVAHNARFDASFLRAAFARYEYEVPFDRSVCTLKLARWLMKGETRDMRLETLSAAVGANTRPCHRAFPDAQATTDLFHRLLELAGPHGVLTLEDLTAFSRVGRRPAIDKAYLAADIPRVTGIYRFLDIRGRILYIGKAKDLRSRVRSYFYGDERAMVAGLVSEVAKVEYERAPTELAAEVRELRLIDKHQPRYNRRGRDRGRGAVYLRIDPGPHARIICGRTLPSKSIPLLGPFRGRTAAMQVLTALQEALPIPRCSEPRSHPLGCSFGQIGRCVAPCQEEGRAAHRAMIEGLIDQLRSGGCLLFDRLRKRMAQLAGAERYEEAAEVRDRIQHLARSIHRGIVVQSLRGAGDLVYAAPLDGVFEITCISGGRLVGTEVVDEPTDAQVERLLSMVPDAQDDTPISNTEVDEAMLIWRHLSEAGRRRGFILYCSGQLTSPAGGGHAASMTDLVRTARAKVKSGSRSEPSPQGPSTRPPSRSTPEPARALPADPMPHLQRRAPQPR